MKPNHFYPLILAGFTLLIVLACNALVPDSTATPSFPPANHNRHSCESESSYLNTSFQ